MSNVINMDLLSRPGKAIIRRGATRLADVPEGYTSFVCYGLDIVITGANVPAMRLNPETNQFEKIELSGVDHPVIVDCKPMVIAHGGDDAG